MKIVYLVRKHLFYCADFEGKTAVSGSGIDREQKNYYPRIESLNGRSPKESHPELQKNLQVLDPEHLELTP